MALDASMRAGSEIIGQLDLFSEPAAEIDDRSDCAIDAQHRRNANPTYLAEAKRITLELASRGEFVGEDVNDRLDILGVHTGSKTALGQVFRQLQKAGEIVNTGRRQKARNRRGQCDIWVGSGGVSQAAAT